MSASLAPALHVAFVTSRRCLVRGRLLAVPASRCPSLAHLCRTAVPGWSAGSGSSRTASTELPHEGV